MAAKRVSTGSERTMAMSDKSACSGPTRLTATATIHPQTTLPKRQKAYRFDDEPGVESSGLERAAHALVPHETPARRHTVLSHHPIPLGPQVQNVNRMKTPIFHPPPTIVLNLGQWAIVGVQEDSSSGSASALLAGPVASRTSSLTHVAPPINHSLGELTPFYPDFLRKRVTPARRDLVAEDVDKELLLRAIETDGMGREFSRLSAEIRDFLKN